MGFQALHPAQLVGKLFSVDRIAVGQIDRRDTQNRIARRNDGFDVTGLLVTIVTRQADANIIQRILRNQRHTVVGLLPVNREIVPKVLQFGAREGFIRRFRLLQADNIRIGFLQPDLEIFHPHFERINVERGYFHGILRLSRRFSATRQQGVLLPNLSTVRFGYIHRRKRGLTIRYQRSSI